VRLPNSQHAARPWRIHDIVRDFRIEDVWALPVTGSRDDFARLVEQFASFDPLQTSAAARTLFTIRLKLGGLLGLDRTGAGVGSRVPTLRDRLPADLRDAGAGPELGGLPFTSLYMLDDEWAAEAVNRTMHGVIHLGWVPDDEGRYRGEMAIYVKPNGLLGEVYMAAIKPFRYLIVYPAILRGIGDAWRAGVPA
jgi:hypothetical protein